MKARVSDRLQRACAGLVILGGALIALGSQWRFTTQDHFASTRSFGAGGRAAYSPGPPPIRQASLSSWVLLTLVLGALIVISLAIDAASARPRREPVLRAVLLIALLETWCVAYLGAWTSGTSLSLGSGFALTAAGCVLVALLSAAWIVALRRGQPHSRPARNPRRSLESAM